MNLKSVAAVGAACFAVVALVASGEQSTSEGSSDATTEATQQAEAPAETTAGIGTPVRDGKFEFTVTGVEAEVPTVGDDFLGATAQGAFTIVSMTVTNIGDEPQFFSDSNVAGIDSQGREVAADGGASLYANEDPGNTFTDINPGNSVQVNVVFDLPVGTTLSEVEVKDSTFSNGAMISLT